MPDDILLNKRAIIQRCMARVREEYGGQPLNLENVTRQDAIVLNLQRACEASIDLAMHAVARRNLGVPQTSREAFALLKTNRSCAPPDEALDCLLRTKWMCWCWVISSSNGRRFG